MISEEVSPRVDASGEVHVIARPDVAHPSSSVEIDDTAVVIHERLMERDSAPILLEPSALPILLERRRPSEAGSTAPDDAATDDAAPDEDVVVLESRKPAYQRPEKRTQMGIGAMPAVTRAHRDTEASSVPDVGDATNVETPAVPDAPDADAPDADPTIPPPIADDDTRPHAIGDTIDTHADTLDARASDDDEDQDDEDDDDDDDDDEAHDVADRHDDGEEPDDDAQTGVGHRAAEASDDDEVDDDKQTGPMTAVMSAVELDACLADCAGWPNLRRARLAVAHSAFEAAK